MKGNNHAHRPTGARRGGAVHVCDARTTRVRVHAIDVDGASTPPATTSRATMTTTMTTTTSAKLPYETFDSWEDGDLGAGFEEEDQHVGTVAGVVALIVGSTVGAGVLALPTATAAAGILPSSGALLGIWTLLLCDALLLAEVNVAIMRERDEDRLYHGRGHSPVVISLSDMAAATLGEEGKLFTSSLYTFMSLTVLIAYISKASDILSSATGLDVSTAAAIFTVGLGGTLCVGGSKVADKLNQALTYGLLAMFLLLVLSGAFYADWDSASWIGSVDAVPSTIPIIFLTLVFHDLVPVVCTYLNGDLKKVRRGILIGSTIPLGMFLAWNAVALALVDGKIGADPLKIISEEVGGAATVLLSAFGLSAIGTSFIGTSLGLSEYLMPKIDDVIQNMDESKEKSPLVRKLYEAMDVYEGKKASFLPSTKRVVAFTSMLAVPLFVAQTFPDIFLPVSTFVGAYGMTLMYGVMPPLMAWKMREQSDLHGVCETKQPSFWHCKITELLPGGQLVLSALSASAIAIAASKIHDDFTHAIGTADLNNVPVAVGLQTVTEVANVLN